MNRYSSLPKLISVTRLVFKFISKMNISHNFPHPLKYWLQRVQEETYRDEIKFMMDGKIVKGSIIEKLGLYLEDDVIRCRGRLQNAELGEYAKHPILLPKTHHLTTLIVFNAHNNVMHGGVQDTLNCIRETFWIPQGRQSVKGVIKSCVICRRVDARTYMYPGPPPLPKERVQLVKPFDVTGVDYMAINFRTSVVSP
nr:uncharacterized protein LOC128701789 [Cherax quadricarinatus]